MSDLKKEFDAAAADAKNLREAAGNDAKLKLYGLFKQGGAGDVTGARPGFMDLVGRAKYDAWADGQGHQYRGRHAAVHRSGQVLEAQEGHEDK